MLATEEMPIYSKHLSSMFCFCYRKQVCGNFGVELKYLCLKISLFCLFLRLVTYGKSAGISCVQLKYLC